MGAIIVAPAANRAEARAPIHFYGGIAVAYFKVNAADTLVGGALHEVIEKKTADSEAMMRRQDRKQ